MSGSAKFQYWYDKKSEYKPVVVEQPKTDDSKSSPVIGSTGANPVAGARPSFMVAVKYVLENEDGVNWDHDHGMYTNDPRDPGGRTMWGVIQTEYEDFLGKPLTEQEIKEMPRDTALAIYKKKFWDVIHGDQYSSQAAATSILDTAVNKGLGGCMVVLTDALHKHFPDRYGAELIAAVNTMPPKDFLLAHEAALLRYISARIERFPNMAWARNGWSNRAVRMLTLA